MKKRNVCRSKTEREREKNRLSLIFIIISQSQNINHVISHSEIIHRYMNKLNINPFRSDHIARYRFLILQVSVVVTFLEISIGTILQKLNFTSG